MWDGSFIEVTGESLPEKVIIGNLYRPPRHNSETIKQFCQELAPIISKVSKSGPHVIITGEFNIDLLQINDQSEYQKYFNLFVARGFFSKITVPTRCCKSSSSLIDQIFCQLKGPKQHLSSCVVKSCISDNFPYLCIFDISKKTRLGSLVRNSKKSAVPMQTLFRQFLMKLNQNLLL